MFVTAWCSSLILTSRRIGKARNSNPWGGRLGERTERGMGRGGKNNISLSLYMTAERAVMYVKKVTYFGEFCYLNSSCIRKSITLMFMSSSRNEFTLLYQNSVTDVFVGFRPPCWCPSGWAPAWRLLTNFYKFG